MTTTVRRFRDEIRSYVVAWLSDRHYATPELSAGFRFLWSLVAPLDDAMEALIQGIRAPQPGQGTPTAFPLIGRSRGIIRGYGETDASYTLRLIGWLDRWRIAGTAEAVARAVQDYIVSKPKVRVITRSGVWVTAETDGSITRTTAAWNWDATTNPERAGYWSELWVVIYPTPWAVAPGSWGDGGLWGTGDGFGLGHQVTRIEYDAIRGLLAQWKSAHTKISAVIWTSDATLFDPATPGSLPNGSWGDWSTTGAAARVPNSRNLTTCRYWEG
jgi:hypothetical protein